MPHSLAGVLALAAASPLLAQDPFREPAELMAGLVPAADCTFIDVDGDGLSDVLARAFTGFRPTQVYLVRSLGGGHFADATPVEGATDEVVSFAAGDINGDGDADLFLQRRVGSGITWEWLAGDGTGAFAVQNGATANAPELVGAEVHDMDGDGDGDLVARTSVVAWYENTGGAFSATPNQLDATPGGFQVADLDGDGVLDVLLGDESSVLTSPFRGVLPGLGAGAFGPAVAPFPLGSMRSVVAGDLDGDGLSELISHTGTALVVRRATGPFTWNPEEVIPSINMVEGVRAPVDLDGDGDLDLRVLRATLNVPRGFWLQNDGTGQISTPAIEVANGAQFYDHGDFDGDGRVDLLDRGSGEVLLNQQANPLYQRPGLRLFLSAGFQTIVTADLNEDGDLDLVGVPFIGSNLLVALGVGGGEFEEPTRLGFGEGGALFAFAADLNDDGHVDLGIQRTAGNIGLLAGDGTGALQPAMPLVNSAFSFPTGTPGLRAIDLDADGDQDLVGLEGDSPRSLVWQRNEGGGVFLSQVIGVAEGFQPADLDGDGAVDLVTMLTSGEVLWRRNLGLGIFGAPSSIALAAPANVLLVDDLDTDGLDDLILVSSDGIDWARRSAAGAVSFDPVAQVVAFNEPGFSYFPRDVQAGDADGDGNLDLLIVVRPPVGDPILRTYLGDGGGGIAGTLELAPSNGSFSDVVVIDIEGDGDTDVLVSLSLAIALLESSLVDDVGTTGCTAATPNSTGLEGRIHAFGQVGIPSPHVRLFADRLPPQQFGLFASSRTFGAPMSLPGSAGVLCLTGNIGRYNLPGEIRLSGPDGTFELQLDPSALREGTGNAPAVAGESWSFQAWHRDLAGGMPTSNLTDAVTVTF